MRIFQLLGAVALAALSVSSFANHNNCNEFKNDQARQNCREHHNDHNCYDKKNNKAKENCRDNQQEHHGDADKNDQINWPNQQHNARSKTLKEAQQFCGSAHSALDHDACMSGQGYPKH